MANDDTPLFHVEKVEYATVITIREMPRLKHENPTEKISGSSWKAHVISYILTKLSRGGTVFGLWEVADEQAVWKYSPKVIPSYGLPEFEASILCQNPTVFRMVIGPFGMRIMNQAYFGAGIFFLRFKDDPDRQIHFSCALSNTRETGFWIRLQTI